MSKQYIERNESLDIEGFFCPFMSTSSFLSKCNEQCNVFDPDLGLCSFQTIRQDTAERQDELMIGLEKLGELHAFFGVEDSLATIEIEEPEYTD